MNAMLDENSVDFSGSDPIAQAVKALPNRAEKRPA